MDIARSGCGRVRASSESRTGARLGLGLRAALKPGEGGRNFRDLGRQLRSSRASARTLRTRGAAGLRPPSRDLQRAAAEAAAVACGRRCRRSFPGPRPGGSAPPECPGSRPLAAASGLRDGRCGAAEPGLLRPPPAF
ncbi:zinc finger protein 518B isoform X2 [Balaenoptera musculus]|uniref:Zinc finger protein 518B isoform X2 n=1 Tax=Balaenoptera musculus TaxID=9771 RepID=A0A8B8XE26_BALMU|nr:zinc finger protein 518B isoform X2 [Balaenoptera musculus]